jgi:hypothetical protein
MPRDATQVIFECPEQFRRRLQQEKLKRGMSVKRMIMDALRQYWRDEEPQTLLELAFVEEDAETKHWTDMFAQYMERCPPAKVELLQKVIQEDLKAHPALAVSKKGQKAGEYVVVRASRVPAKSRRSRPDKNRTDS